VRKRVFSSRRRRGREEVKERVEGIEKGVGGCGCHDPFGSSIFNVMLNYVDADLYSRPTEAVN
jgi:hypothetical protein